MVESSYEKGRQKLRVGIIGTGKIGTDLLMKVLRSEQMDCELFVGRNLQSPGMQKAQQLGVRVSDLGIKAFEDDSHQCELVFDATGAEHHREHAKVFAKKGIKAIDLTPAKMGPLCIPALNEQVILKESNVNMVTCGGQASVPVCEAVKKAVPSLKSVSVHTLVSDDSIGQATLDNIDDYYATTSKAINQFAGVDNVCIDLEVDEPGRQPTMCTTLNFSIDESEHMTALEALEVREKELKRYVPGLSIETKLGGQHLLVKVTVSGMGDWIPAHAGNLDIINCAAIAVAERYALSLSEQKTSLFNKLFDPFTRIVGGRQLANA
ncbi:acetylating acetaldehyde dehydrogenase [Agaribacterium sp. ZY112]|uniref:acetylating acetaldehyde dehydrogenase n=1 Tax=Agaribacterium sp. ZY112 TaxID=3233574 RepID=UPI0035269BAF